MAEAPQIPTDGVTLATKRRRQIFRAACRVLARKSFHEATVKEIAEEAGLAAGSIYVYLRSKDDILLLLGESMVAELVLMLPEIHERGAGDPQRELLELMRAVLDVIDRYREAFTVLHHEVRYLARREAYREHLDRTTDAYLSAIAAVLERGRKLGVIRFDDLRSVVYTIHMLCTGWAMGADYLKRSTKEAYWREISALVEGRFFTHPKIIANGARRSAKTLG